jgi:hypothetical protein
MQRLLVTDGIDDLMALWTAVVRATGRHQAELDDCRRLLALPAEELNPRPFISGKDLTAHGLFPGPDFQRLLEAVRDAQLEKRISSKQAALELVDRLRTAGSDLPESPASG